MYVLDLILIFSVFTWILGLAILLCFVILLVFVYIVIVYSFLFIGFSFFSSTWGWKVPEN